MTELLTNNDIWNPKKSQKLPKVSVIVPVYNAEKYIVRCIESVKAQTLLDWEMIMVDDASSDNSVKYLVAAAEMDKRIHIIRNNVNSGPMVARHQGVMATKGEYITFLDSDDTLTENALEAMYNAAKIANADIVSGNMLRITVDGSKETITYQLNHGSDKLSVFKSLLEKEFGHNLCSKLFLKGLLQYSYYEILPKAKMGEDACLFYQIVDRSTKTVQIEDYIYNYYETYTSSSHKRKTDADIKSILLACSIQAKICGKYPKLSKDLFCWICEVISALYADGYKKCSSIDKMVNDMSLRQYVCIKGMITNMSPIVLLEVLFKRYFFPVMGRNFNGWRR